MNYKDYFAISFAIGLGLTALLLFGFKNTIILKKGGVGIAKFLMALGYTKEQASGIAGNIFVESTYNPTAVGDNGTSFGLAQWHNERWDRLIDFSESQGFNHKTIEAQLRYLDWELKNKEKKAYRELKKAKTPYDSAYAFAKYFERPSHISEVRMSKAEEIYNKIK